MAKLFNSIRRKLISDKPSFERTSNYLKYAIGEIVLVVIGILIALSINNWNDIRKNKKFSHEILLLIDQNLQQDSLALSTELFKSKQAVVLTNRLMHQVALKNYNDSLNYWMGKIISFERFKSQSSAFEVLKAKGIENIQDNKLQLALISYYDDNLFNVYKSLFDVENSFNSDWVPVIKQNFSDFKFMNYSQPINSKNFFEKPSTITLFKLYKDNRAGSVRNLERAKAKISRIRKLIKNNTQN